MGWLAFARGEVKLESGEVKVEGRVVHRLSPKATQLLAAFIARPDSVLSRDQILALAWGGQPRTDDAVTKIIAELRRSLAPCVDEGFELIETLPKRGYRWKGQTDLPQQDAAPQHTGAIQRSWRLPYTLFASILLLLGLSNVEFGGAKADRRVQPWVNDAYPISASTADESSAAISADGTHVIASEFDVESQRYVLLDRWLSGDKTEVVRKDKTSHLVSPSWSRDEQFVAYRKLRDDRCQLALLNLANHVEVALGVCPPDADARLEFAPDGRSLVLSEDLVTEIGAKALRLVQVELKTGSRSAFQFSGHALYGKDIRFSPNGTQALVRQFDRFESLLLVDFVHSTRRRVLEDAARIRGFDFDADELHVLFSAELDGKPALWRLGLADGNLDPTPYVDATLPQVARTSPIMVFRTEARRIRLVQRRGEDLAPIFESTRNEYAPAESPDGRWLAFLSDRTGTTQIFMVEKETGAIRRLSEYVGRVPESAVFTPDSRELLVQLRVKRLLLDYEIIDIESGRTRKLNTTESAVIDFRPAALPGQFLYAAFRAQRPPHLFVHDETTGKSTLLTPCEGRAPRIGPENWLYFLEPNQRTLRRTRPGGQGDCEFVATLNADQVRQFTAAAPFEPDALLHETPARAARIWSSAGEAGDLMWVDRGTDRVKMTSRTPRTHSLAQAH